MRLTVARCLHIHVRTYQANDPNVVRGLCETCFKRVFRPKTAPAKGAWELDQPIGGTCPHTRKVEIENRLTVNKPYRNAMCVTCGAGLRAPTNQDDWKPLHEYRYIVREWA